MPVRHGLTMGELAQLFNGENAIGADLVVVPMRNWTRGQWYDDTGLPWINPSPNMRNLDAGGAVSGRRRDRGPNVSVGRGTPAPFEQIGAPWIDGVALAAALNARKVPGVRFYPVRFTPVSSRYKDEACQGVFMIVTDREALRPVRVGMEIASALSRMYGPTFDTKNTDRLVGSSRQLARIVAGEDAAGVAEGWAADEAKWRLLRVKFLLVFLNACRLPPAACRLIG